MRSTATDRVASSVTSSSSGPSLAPKRGPSPQNFSSRLLWANGWMDQDGTWRGICVRLGPSPLPQKRAEPASPIFGPCLLWPNGWMHPSPLYPLQDFKALYKYCIIITIIIMPLGMEVGLSTGDFVLDGDPAPPQKGGGAPPNFRALPLAAKRLHGSRCHLVRR